MQVAKNNRTSREPRQDPCCQLARHAGAAHRRRGTLVAHVHVPKTGGDAFYAVFRGFFPLQLPADRSSHQYPGCARGNQVTTLHSYRSEIGDCVLRKRAKFTPGVATHRKVEKVKFILGVRNPVERVLSEYYWNVRLRRGEIGNNPKEMPAERIWPQELHDVEDDLLKWVLRCRRILIHSRPCRHQ